MKPALGAGNSSFAVQEAEPDLKLAEPDDPESGATLSASCQSSPQVTYHIVYTGQSQYPAGPSNDPDTIDSFAAVTAYLRSRMLDPFSAAATSMTMRPCLHAAYTNLLNLLSSTAETPGANHSFLLLGARGTGKSLVWRR